MAVQTHRHRRGIISTPKLDSELDVEVFIQSYAGRGGSGLYVPPLRGKAAVEASGRPLEDFGPIVHLNKTEDGQDKEIDWDGGIEISKINRAISFIPYEDGFVAVMNADFDCAFKVAEPAVAKA